VPLKTKKGYKTINGAGVIQGDGINLPVVKNILDAALKEGYSAASVAYGMGGGLLQKVNRDTMSFATKLCYIEYADGTVRDVMKLPKSDTGKVSFPGILRVKRDPQTGLEYIYPRAADDNSNDKDDLLRVVYDHKPISGVWDDFETLRNRVQTEWTKAPKHHNPVSAELRTKIDKWVENQKKVLAQTAI